METTTSLVAEDDDGTREDSSDFRCTGVIQWTIIRWFGRNGNQLLTLLQVCCAVILLKPPKQGEQWEKIEVSFPVHPWFADSTVVLRPGQEFFLAQSALERWVSEKGRSSPFPSSCFATWKKQIREGNRKLRIHGRDAFFLGFDTWLQCHHGRLRSFLHWPFFSFPPGPPSSLSSSLYSKVLVVHVRLGDVVHSSASWRDGTGSYHLFPPCLLSFLAHQFLFDAVFAVTEDPSHEYISHVSRCLQEQSIPFLIQSGTAREDWEVLRNSTHLLLSNSTFCSSAVLFHSGHLKTLIQTDLFCPFLPRSSSPFHKDAPENKEIMYPLIRIKTHPLFRTRWQYSSARTALFDSSRWTFEVLPDPSLPSSSSSFSSSYLFPC